MNTTVVAAAVLLLAGCSGSIVERSYPGLPAGSDPLIPSAPPTAGISLPEPDLGPRAQWAGEGELLAVTLGGSSTCPVEPTGLAQVGRDYLEVQVATRSGWFFGACTADLALKTYEIRVPDSVAADTPVTVRVSEREFTLGPRRSTPDGRD